MATFLSAAAWYRPLGDWAFIKSTFRVPQQPSSPGGQIAIWNGLMQAALGQTPLVQTFLQHGVWAGGGGNYWAIGGEIIRAGGQGQMVAKVQRVNPGAFIQGVCQFNGVDYSVWYPDFPFVRINTYIIAPIGLKHAVVVSESMVTNPQCNALPHKESDCVVSDIVVAYKDALGNFQVPTAAAWGGGTVLQPPPCKNSFVLNINRNPGAKMTFKWNN